MLKATAGQQHKLKVKRSMLKPVIQEDVTACSIASVAHMLGNTYAEIKTIANAMGIHAKDESLWFDTQLV